MSEDDSPQSERALFTFFGSRHCAKTFIEEACILFLGVILDTPCTLELLRCHFFDYGSGRWATIYMIHQSIRGVECLFRITGQFFTMFDGGAMLVKVLACL